MTGPSRALLPLRIFLALVVAATVGLALHMARPWGDNYAYQDASGYLALAGFLLWAVSPMAMLAWAAGLFGGSGTAMAVFATGSACIALVGVHAYIDAAVLHPDAQGGLVFVFVPLVQWGVATCLLAACLLLRRLSR